MADSRPATWSRRKYRPIPGRAASVISGRPYPRRPRRCRDLVGRGRGRLGLERAVGREHLGAERGEARAAVAGAAAGGRDQRRAVAGVHRLDQRPGALVAHPHPPAGGGDRAGVADAFEQVGLARPEHRPRGRRRRGCAGRCGVGRRVTASSCRRCRSTVVGILQIVLQDARGAVHRVHREVAVEGHGAELPALGQLQPRAEAREVGERQRRVDDLAVGLHHPRAPSASSRMKTGRPRDSRSRCRAGSSWPGRGSSRARASRGSASARRPAASRGCRRSRPARRRRDVRRQRRDHPEPRPVLDHRRARRSPSPPRRRRSPSAPPGRRCSSPSVL